MEKNCHSRFGQHILSGYGLVLVILGIIALLSGVRLLGIALAFLGVFYIFALAAYHKKRNSHYCSASCNMNHMAYGIGFGAVLGIATGIIIGSIALGLAMGTSLGVAMGVIWESQDS